MLERRTNAEIAEDLVITVATVRTHVRNIYAKLDVHSTKELRELCCAEGEEDGRAAEGRAGTPGSPGAAGIPR